MLEHVADTHLVLGDMKMHASLQHRAPCTAEAAIADLLPMLARDDAACCRYFLHDLFGLMTSVYIARIPQIGQTAQQP